MKDTSKAIHYIRKNRETEVMIYLKDNKEKAAQKLFCMAHCLDKNYKVLGDTTNLEDVKNCNMMLIAKESMLSDDKDEYKKIVQDLKKKGIAVEVVIDEAIAGRYIDMALELYRKGRV